MASVAVMQIEVSPPGNVTPHLPHSRRPHRRAHTDTEVVALMEHHHHTPRTAGQQGYNSSGYMSSSSNLQTPHVDGRTRPPQQDPWSGEDETEDEEDGTLSQCSNNRQFSPSATGNYYRPVFHEDDIYSRLDHHSNSSTLTRQTHTPRHNPPPHSLNSPLPHTPHITSPLVDHVMTTMREHQQESNNVFQFPTPPVQLLHSNAAEAPSHSGSAQFLHRPEQHRRLRSNTEPVRKARRPKKQWQQQQRRAPPPLVALLRGLGDLDGEVRRWLVKADQHLKRNEFDKAVPYLEGTIVRTQCYPRLQLLLWELLGSSQLALGYMKKASMCSLHHLTHARALGDTRALGKAECNLGIAYMQMGLFKLAGRCFIQYLKSCRSLGDEWGVQSACNNLGQLSKTLGLRNYRVAMEEGVEEEGVAMVNLVTCLQRAVIFFKQHLEIVSAHGDMEKQGRAYGNIGYCYELLKEYPEAIFYHKKRLEVARALGDMYSESCTLCNLGNCLRAKGSLGEAVDYYQMNLEMAQSVGDLKMEELLHVNLGITYELLNQLDDAIRSYTLHLGLVVASGDQQKLARGFIILARLYQETGQLTKAHEYFTNVVEIFKKLGDQTSLESAKAQLQQLSKLMKLRQKSSSSSSAAAPRHTFSKKWRGGRFRGHTVSRASNFHQEVKSHASSSTSSAAKTGTWSVKGKKLASSLATADSLSPDPILLMVDMAPRWAGQPFDATNTHHHDFSSTMPPPARSWSHDHRGRSCDIIRGRSRDHRAPCHAPSLLLETQSFSSYESGEYNHLTPSPEDHTHHIQYGYSSEGLSIYSDNGRDNYELVGPPQPLRPARPPPPNATPPADLTSVDDVSSNQCSMALPQLSYCSSATPSGRTTPQVIDVEVEYHGNNTSCEEVMKEEVEELDNHLKELQKAGLELARAGLQLAGYKGLEGLGLEEETDKEWEQWQEMNLQDNMEFGSLTDIASSAHKKSRQLYTKNMCHTTSAPLIIQSSF